MQRKYYTARWAQFGKPDRANVSFAANNDANAKKQADSIAKKLNVTHLQRTITEAGRIVEWK